MARAAAAFLLLASPVATAAQDAADETVGDAADMQALETAVPKQSWYPDGYYDVRIAAEAEVAETATTSVPDAGAPFNLLACRVPDDSFGTDDPLLNAYGAIALEVARLRFELNRRHFPEARYATPLVAFERDRIAAKRPKDQIYGALSDALNGRANAASPDVPTVVAVDDCATTAPSPPPSAAAAQPSPARPARPTAEERAIAKAEAENDQRQAAAYEQQKAAEAQEHAARLAAMEAESARREQQAAASQQRQRAMRASAPKPSAAPPPAARGVVFSTQPPAGEVLMINAFAFKVCTRKNPDPWDRFQCKWNEIETGVPKPLSGRFVYQVKWPDGTIRKGTREIAPADTGAVTFRKVGS